MTFLEVIDIATKAAGVFALLIIAVPKLTELVLGRYLSGALEKQKQALQMDLEAAKAELTKSVETHKANLGAAQRADTDRETRKQLVIKNEAAALEAVLVDIRNTTAKLNGDAVSTFKIVTEFLDRLLVTAPTQSQTCCSQIRLLDDLSEKPAALGAKGYTQELRDQMLVFSSQLDIEIKLLRERQ